MTSRLNLRQKLISAALATGCLAIPYATAGTEYPVLSPDITIVHSSTVVADEDAAEQLGASVTKVFLGNLPGSADVDAVHTLDNGDVLFSLDTTAMLGGTAYRPRDVIRFSDSGWSKEFDGVAAGIPDGVNVDAVAMSGDDLLISVDVGAAFGGLNVEDSDVIAFDGADFTLFLDASAAGISEAADVDALYLTPGGDILLSLDSGGTVSGIVYADEDLLSWSSPTWTLFFDGSADDSAWLAADLDAWSRTAFLHDLFFEDGFE
jgi:hypothetical protein